MSAPLLLFFTQFNAISYKNRKKFFKKVIIPLAMKLSAVIATSYTEGFVWLLAIGVQC